MRDGPARAAPPLISIDNALTDPNLLAPALGSLPSWSTWRAVLKAAFGLPLNRFEARAFASVAGNRKPPAHRVRELWAIVGRRGGKSRIAAALAVYSACFQEHTLARGEVGMVLVLAASRDQARTVFEYVKGFLDASPVLRQEVITANQSEVTLRNGIVIAVHSNSFRTIRGRTLIACIFDEVAFWRDEASAMPDVETYRAVLPSLATTNGMLIGISTPYRKLGLLHQKYRDHYGIAGDEVLVVKGGTKQFNPTLPDSTIATQRLADPTSAASEWDAEFRADITSFLDDDLIDACVAYDRPLELSPRPSINTFYRAFCDPSGGVGADAYTLAIAHKEGEGYALDLVRGTRGKFDPQEVTRNYAALLKEYHIGSVTGDAYAAQWVANAWMNENISYVRADKSKSEIYRECLPLFTRGLVRLPDHHILLRELRLLERQAHRGGKESIDHPRGGHDDFANAVCGVLHTLSNYLGFSLERMLDDGEANTAQREAEDRAAWQHHRLQNFLAAHGAFGWPPTPWSGGVE